MVDLPGKTAPMSHLSIGEVLALLLEEFSDVSISKIRFLESQGLIDPERTPSGYRKFYDDDVELLRCILREQRENYLPLRVIKDRLDSGEIDPTSEIPRPRGIRNMPDDDSVAGHPAANPIASSGPAPLTGAEALFARTDSDSTIKRVAESIDQVNDQMPADTTVSPSANPVDDVKAPSSLPSAALTRDKLCSMASIDAAVLANLESYGVITGLSGATDMYGQDALEVATIAKQFLDAGFDERHLRGWKVAVDREAGLFEQMIQPLLRQRNPKSRAQARQQLTEMEQIGGQLRSALMRSTMRRHYED